MKKFESLFICGLMLCACNSNELEFDNIELQPVNGIYVIPLGEISYTMQKLLREAEIEDDSLQIGSDSVYVLTYTDELSYTAKDEFVEINDVADNGTLTVPPSLATGVVTAPRTVTVSDSYVQTYNPEDSEELDSVFHDEGELAVTVTSTANVSRVDFQFTFRNTLNLDTGDPITVIGTLNSPGTGNAAEALANHATLFPEETNEFDLDFEVSFVLAAGQELMGNETVAFNFVYRDQTFLVIYGKFGQTTVLVGDEVLEFDFFNDLDEGISFGNPTLRFNFVNSFGIPLAIDFSGLFGDDGAGGDQIFLSGPVTNPRRFPEIAASPDINSTNETTIEVTPSNSNIRSVFASSPSRIVFDVTATSNYYDTDNSELNFAKPDDSVTAVVDLEIPLEMKLEDFQESFQYELGEGLDVENVDSAFLRVVTLNELPFSGLLTMEIQDEAEQVLYTIPESMPINTPFISVNGLVTDPNSSSVDIPLPREAIDALEMGNFINMNLTINTPESPISDEVFVKIRPDYTIQIKVGLGGLVNVSF